nr:ATP-binding protein [Paracoccus yeei]
MRLAQTLFRDAGDTLILFDEIEDLMPAYNPFSRSEGSKVHQNVLFEENPVPILWTTNDISGIPASIRRRIGYSIEMRPPAAPVRSRVMARLAAGQGLDLPAGQLDRLARQNPVAPAVLATALRSAALAGGGMPALEQALSTSRRLVEGRPPRPQAVGGDFDAALSAADVDLAALTRRLRGSDRRVSLCLSGLPGTGKSAFARHLAAEMGLEMIAPRGQFAAQLAQQTLGRGILQPVPPAGHAGEIARHQPLQMVKPGRRIKREELPESPPRLRRVQRAELDLQAETAQAGRIQPLDQVGGAGNGQRVALHPGQHLIDLADFPGMPRPRPVAQQRIRLVEDQEAAGVARLGKGGGDVLLGAADPHRQQIRGPLLEPMRQIGFVTH